MQPYKCYKAKKYQFKNTCSVGRKYFLDKISLKYNFSVTNS